MNVMTRGKAEETVREERQKVEGRRQKRMKDQDN
jgi:hypothetical protein